MPVLKFGLLLLALSSLPVLGEELLPSFAKDGSVTWLLYTEGGRGRWDFGFVIDLERQGFGTLLGKSVYEARSGLATNDVQVCSAEDWREIVTLLEDSDIPSWPDNFAHPYICDGTVWELQMKRGTNVVRSIYRSNDAPPKFRALHRIFEKMNPEVSRRGGMMDAFARCGFEFNLKMSLEEALLKLDSVEDGRTWEDKSTGLTWHYRLDEDSRAVLIGYSRYLKNHFCITPSPVGKLVLPEKIDGHTLVAIGEGALGGCTNITEIVIPAGVKKIECGFWTCDALTRISVAPGNASFRSVDGLLYEKDDPKLFAYPRKSSVPIPEFTTSIGKGACAMCETIRQLVVPPSVKVIDRSAFQGCPRLEKVVLPDSVEYVEKMAFRDCPELKEVVMTQSLVTRSAMNAFQGTPYEKTFKELAKSLLNSKEN